MIARVGVDDAQLAPLLAQLPLRAADGRGGEPEETDDGGAERGYGGVRAARDGVGGESAVTVGEAGEPHG